MTLVDPLDFLYLSDRDHPRFVIKLIATKEKKNRQLGDLICLEPHARPWSCCPARWRRRNAVQQDNQSKWNLHIASPCRHRQVRCIHRSSCRYGLPETAPGSQVAGQDRVGSLSSELETEKQISSAGRRQLFILFISWYDCWVEDYVCHCHKKKDYVCQKPK